jgi:hypothetical protein
VNQNRLTRRPALALSTVWFFVLLLASSAPHRVHHLFENLPSSQQNGHHAETRSAAAVDGHEHGHDHHGGHDNSKDSSDRSPKTDCVAQTVAQNSLFAQSETIEITYLEAASETQPPVILAWHYHFSSSPFSQRAPPRA